MTQAVKLLWTFDQSQQKYPAWQWCNLNAAIVVCKTNINVKDIFSSTFLKVGGGGRDTCSERAESTWKPKYWRNCNVAQISKDKVTLQKTFWGFV